MSPFFTAGEGTAGLSPPQSSAASRQAVSLHIPPDSSPRMSLSSEISFPASGPFLIRIVSGPSASRTAARTFTLWDTFCRGMRLAARAACAWSISVLSGVRVCRLKWKAGKWPTEEASE